MHGETVLVNGGCGWEMGVRWVRPRRGVPMNGEQQNMTDDFFDFFDKHRFISEMTLTPILD